MVHADLAIFVGTGRMPRDVILEPHWEEDFLFVRIISELRGGTDETSTRQVEFEALSAANLSTVSSMVRGCFSCK